MSKKQKKISQKVIPSGTKQIKSQENPESFMQKRPSWCFELVDEEGKWNPYRVDFKFIVEHLVNFERMTWDEVFKKTHDSGKSGNHYITPDKLCKNAQDRFRKLNLEEYADSLYSIRLNNLIRIFGLLRDGVFYILWFDEKHEICPSKLKHS